MDGLAGEYEIGQVGPLDDELRRCVESYYADISTRFGQRVTLEKYPNPPSVELVPPRGVFLVVRHGGVSVGCGALTTIEPRVGYVSRMWVAQEARGRGLGRGLLTALEHWAVSLGHERIRLYTHRSLTEAQALYRGSGYTEIAAGSVDAPFADIWFEKKL